MTADEPRESSEPELPAAPAPGGCRVRAVLIGLSLITLVALGFFLGTSRGRVTAMMTAWPLIRPGNYRRRRADWAHALRPVWPLSN